MNSIGHPGELDDIEKASTLLLSIPETGEALDARARLLGWGLAQLGDQEPDRYYKVAAPQFLGSKPNQFSWCGVFCLAGLLENYIAPADWQWETGLGFVHRLTMHARPQAPGDIVVFPGKWHHAIVRSWGETRLCTIDGNVLRAPREGVAECERRISDAYGFYSIADLLTP